MPTPGSEFRQVWEQYSEDAIRSRPDRVDSVPPLCLLLGDTARPHETPVWIQ